MKKIISIILGILLLGTTNIYGWTKYGGDIGLQKVTPGTQQIGNLNISGVGILSDITLQDTTPLITLTATTTGDNDWSINVDADNFYIKDETQGLTRLSIDSTGNIGIGTASPSEKLHVAGGDVFFAATGGSVINPNLEIDGTSKFDGNAFFYASVFVTTVDLTMYDNRPLYIGYSGSGPKNTSFEWDTGQNPDAFLWRIVIDAESSGNVLMIEDADSGTNFGHASSTNPTFFIQSADATSVNDYLKFWHDQTDGNIDVGAGNLNLAASGSNVSTVTSGGNVGIGTATPIGRLHTILSTTSPALSGGNRIANLTGVTISNANPSVMTKDATIDDGVAVGNMVIVQSGTNATTGVYKVASIVVDTSVTLDRQAATGICTDAVIDYAKDVIGMFVADSNGQGIRAFGGTQNKPLILGGIVNPATGHSLTSEGVLVGGDLEVDGVAYFDSDIVLSATYGNERVIDGSFSVVGLTDWTLGTGWTDGTGTAAKSADGTGTLTQAVAINAVVGTLYKVTYTITNWSVGTVNMRYGNIIFLEKGANGTYTEYVWAITTDSLIFTPTNTSRFNIDNVSVTTVSSGGASVLEGVTTLRNYIQIDSSIGFFKEVGDEDLALYLDGSQRWRLDLPDLGGITKLSLLGNGTIYSYAQALKLQAGTDQLIQIANEAGTGDIDIRTDSDSTLQVGDGTYSWGHTPQFGVEGVTEFDSAVYFDSDIILSQTQAAGALAGTLTNSVAVGDPSIYLKIKSGASYYAVPGWLIP